MTTLFKEPAPAAAPATKTGSAGAASSKKWLWLAAALIGLVALAVAGARFVAWGGANESIALSVLEREGQLDVEWSRAAAPVTKAVRGTLEIVDGAQTRTIPLKPADLALGKFSYKRDTGDIQVRLIVEMPDGKKVPAASRFLGPPPAQGNAEELRTLQLRRDTLEAEVNRLKQSNDQQTLRIQQLERTLKILQTRPGVN